MATTVAIVGHSGTGKSTSISQLDNKATYLINSDRKSLPFKGWKKAYSVESKNYFKVSDLPTIFKVLSGINGKRKDIKTIIIDTVNGCMVDDEMRRMKEKGYDKWQDLAGAVYDLVSYANNDMRDDLVVVFMFHEMEFRDETGYSERRILTNGKKLEKIILETKFPIVLFTSVEGTGGDNQFSFETRRNNSTAKSPQGMFESYKIENNLKLVIDAIEAYEN